MAELVDALVSGSSGRPCRFKSCYPHQEKRRLLSQSSFFSYIRLRRVILIRSYIRLTLSDIRFASFGGEYNITAERSGAISHPSIARYITEITHEFKSISNLRKISFLSPIHKKKAENVLSTVGMRVGRTEVQTLTSFCELLSTKR